MLNFIKKYWLVVLIITFGMILRLFRSEVGFMYGHDQDLGSWFVKDVVVNGHLRLIGQETSTQGVFIGPLFYYLLIPFFLTNAMDPFGGVWLVSIIALFSLVSIYYVFNKMFNKNVALIGLTVYSASQYMIFNDREVVPTMPVILWTVWFLYSLQLLLKGKQKKGLILAGLLLSLIWHLNFALILLLPLIPITLLLARKKINVRYAILGLLSFIIASIPFILFELRHNFSQIRAVYLSLTTNQYDIISGSDKFFRVLHLLAKDLHGLFIGSYPGIKYEWVLYFLLIVFLIMALKNIISRNLVILFGLWIGLYITFFSSYSKIVSEYYLNGVIVVFIAIFSIFIDNLIKKEKYAHIGYIILGMMIIFSYQKYVTFPLNKSGYVFRKSIVGEIKNDATKRGFECVSVSFITDPGYNLGYRYFIYLSGLKLRPISTDVPVYTIVYPLKKMFTYSVTQGAIGLIYPDYSTYGSLDVINKHCEGDNINITEPLWGFN